MEILQLTTTDSRWDQYVEQHPDGTIYHTLAWKKIVEKHFKKKTTYLYVVRKESDGQEKVVGILPLVNFDSQLFGHAIVSYPYVNYGGMLYSNSEAKSMLLSEASQILSHSSAQYIELRTMKMDEFSLPVKTQKVTYYLTLPSSADELMKQFKAKLRSQIKRPIKEGMYAKCHGKDGIAAFYRIFSTKMRDLGTPVYSIKFFESIFSEIAEHANIVVVYNREHLPVGAAFIIDYKGMMEIPWAATLRSYDRLSPNMLLYFEVLKKAIEKGCHVFDFGRCTKGKGTYRFKKQWGGDEKNLYWYYLLKTGESMPEVNPDNPKYKLAIKIWQKMPVSFANWLGPSIVKHIP